MLSYQAPRGDHCTAASFVDPLSDVIAGLRVDSSAILLFDIAGPWGVNLTYDQGFSWTVVEGSILMRLNGREFERYEVGDTFIFPRGTQGKVYTLLSSPDAKAMDAAHLWRQMDLPEFKPGRSIASPRRLRWGTAAQVDTRIVSTAFSFADRRCGPLIDALPQVLVVRAKDIDKCFLNLLLHFPFDHAELAEPGYLAIAAQSVQLFLMHLVRTYALTEGRQRIGWLGGLSDPKISRAIACIHNEPAGHWSLQRLAAVTGMSRSLFAARFTQCIGQSPRQYLSAWRMHLAREALLDGRQSVSALAELLGYQSESAFRTAFRKYEGKSPREYLRDVRKQSMSIVGT